MEKFKSNCENCPEKGKIYELIKNKPVTGPRADRLRQMAKLQGIPQDQVDAKLSGEGGTLKLCASDSCDIMSFKTDIDLEAKMQELALVPVSTTKENKMKKSQLIKIIKEELNHVLQSEGFFDSFKMPRVGGHPSKPPNRMLSTLAKIGNLQDAFKKYYRITQYDASRGNVSHYFKRGTPSEVLDKAKEYIELGAEYETQFKEYLKSKDMSVNVKVYTANDLVRVSPAPAKQETTPAQDGQRLVAPTAPAPDSGEE